MVQKSKSRMDVSTNKKGAPTAKTEAETSSKSHAGKSQSSSNPAPAKKQESSGSKK